MGAPGHPLPIARWFRASSLMGALLLVLIWLVAVLAPTPDTTFNPYDDYAVSARAAEAVAPFEWMQIWLGNVAACLVYLLVACLGIHATIRRAAGIEERPRARSWHPDGRLARLLRNSPWRVLSPTRTVRALMAVSIAIQAGLIGLLVGVFAHLTGYAEWKVVLVLLPHGIVELPALFLPWAAYWVRRHDEPARAWYREAGIATGVAVVLLLVAAVIEAYVSPSVYDALLPIDHLRPR